jgi:hypothetical protein
MPLAERSGVEGSNRTEIISARLCDGREKAVATLGISAT